ncbi:Flotillin-like protein 3 [Linum perenne]
MHFRSSSIQSLTILPNPSSSSTPTNSRRRLPPTHLTAAANRHRLQPAQERRCRQRRRRRKPRLLTSLSLLSRSATYIGESAASDSATQRRDHMWSLQDEEAAVVGPLYRLAKASEYLAITGIEISDIKLAKKSWILPGQSCTRFDISPVNYTFEVQAMSAQKLPFILPAVFTIGHRYDDQDSLLRYARLICPTTSTLSTSARPWRNRRRDSRPRRLHDHGGDRSSEERRSSSRRCLAKSSSSSINSVCTTTSIWFPPPPPPSASAFLGWLESGGGRLAAAVRCVGGSRRRELVGVEEEEGFGRICKG